MWINMHTKGTYRTDALLTSQQESLPCARWLYTRMRISSKNCTMVGSKLELALSDGPVTTANHTGVVGCPVGAHSCP